MEHIQKLRNFFLRRQQAYQQVFSEQNPFAIEVMKDLAKFCRIHESTFHENERLSAHLEGRREVLLRILKHTKLDPDKYWASYGYPNTEDLD